MHVQHVYIHMYVQCRTRFVRHVHVHVHVYLLVGQIFGGLEALDGTLDLGVSVAGPVQACSHRAKGARTYTRTCTCTYYIHSKFQLYTEYEIHVLPVDLLRTVIIKSHVY